MWFLYQEEYKKLCTKKALLLFLLCILSSCMISYGVTYMKSGYALQPGDYVFGRNAQIQRRISSPQGAIETLLIDVQEHAMTIYSTTAYMQNDGTLNEQGVIALQAEKPLLKLVSLMMKNQDKLVTFDDIKQLRQQTLFTQLAKQKIPASLSSAYLEQQVLPDKILYEDSFSWQMLLHCYPIAAISFLLFLCITMTPIFSNERSLHVDTLLLSSRNGQPKDVRCKIIAALSFTTITYSILMIMFSLFHVLVWGMQGKDVLIQLQAEYRFVYPIYSYLETYGKGMLLGYLASLTTTSLCLLISAFAQKNESAIIASISIVLLPLTPIVHALPSWLNHWFPVHLMMLEDGIKSSEAYVIFQHILTKQQYLALLSFLLLMVCCVLTYQKEGRKWKKITH